MSWNPSDQYGGSAGRMRIEVGDGSGLVYQDGTHTGYTDHGIPTQLTYIAGGWVFCIDGDHTTRVAIGCVSSQKLADHSWGRRVDFTMDITSDGRDCYILFGY